MHLQAYNTEKFSNRTLLAWLIAILTAVVFFDLLKAVILFMLTKVYELFVQHR